MTTKIGLYRCKTNSGVKWRVRWFGKYDPNTGKPKRYSKTFNKKKDAENFQKQKQNEFNKGVMRDPSTKTLKEYAEQWLQNKNHMHRVTTDELYGQTFTRLYSWFGADSLLRQIDRMAAKEFLANLKPLRGTKELSNWTRHRVLRNCKTLFGEAVEDGVISQNPFSGIKNPKTVPSKWYYLKPAEYQALLDSTNSLSKKVLYSLCYTAGLRKTEALTLRWTDVDFDKGRIHIANQQATGKLPPFYVKDTDERIIPLSNHTLDLLLQQQEKAPEKIPYVLFDKQRYELIIEKWKRYQQTGREWKNRDFANNILRGFKADYKRAGIKPVGNLTVHTLRKCCGQNWANVLPMNVVKELMGHSDIATTDKFYSTVSEHHLEQASKVTDDLLSLSDAEPEKTDHKLTFLANLGKNS